jgi:hypothetical protein
MEEDILTKGIGTKESQTALLAKPVVVVGVTIVPVMGKKDSKNVGKEVGKKLVLICKHPDREENIKISSMSYVSGKTLKNSSIWLKLDDDGNIQKGSLIAAILEKYQVPNIVSLDGKTLQTELDENKFLTIKAY